ncbi:hypothetical protein [Micromonospora carbonacea]|uniref:Uncharacterized protein n=1 Tax=Micromonospora carbonacea TaxID=47853 RepID=A0A1C4Z587_9ACTN|nr:hypothetical protein [Micromonospora carbonacea]SCF28212.1 hypothetical protein GA0070563_107276 [Micromonospora carbonacea]
MSYPDQAPARRPAAVGLAATVLVLMAAGAVASAVAALLVLGGTVERFRSAAAGTSAAATQVDDVVLLLRGATVASAVVTVLVGVVLVGLAAGLRAGRPGARVATWAVCGLGALFGCCAVTALVGQRAVPLRLSADGRSAAELLGLVGDAYPGFWLAVNAALSVGQALGYLGVAALLVSPSASAWFRRRHPAPPATAHHPFR